MGLIVDDIIKRFRNENIVGKYIYATVAIFLVIALSSVFAMLFNSVSLINNVVGYFELPSNLKHLLYQPWSLVTYMFLHAGFTHILWNMLALYVFGRIFLNFFSTRHFIGLYLFGGIIGGLFFVVAYNVFPYFESNVDSSYLVGASAAVLAIVTATAVRSPNYTVNMLFFGEVRLSRLAIFTVIFSFLLLASENAGGNFAHIGGAVAGWFFAFMLGKGHDVTSIINSSVNMLSTFWESIIRLFSKKPKMTVKRNKGKHSVDYEYNSRRKEQEDEMNRLLEKIKEGGYSSLSDEEKTFLFDSSKK